MELEDGTPLSNVVANGEWEDDDGEVRSKLTGVLPEEEAASTSETRQLIHDQSDSSGSEDEDYTYSPRLLQGQQSVTVKTPWWFQEPAVKRNLIVVGGAWFLVVLGVVCVIAGLILEILFHTVSLDIVRGFIFILVGIVVLLPSVYAVTHVYLAAKRVGRIRFSSVWFFRN